ncbi:hypothetical protein K9L97_03400 [Candidatus Woesearchaeota archaeon]|nr:hypothetical protein [Candidatus Woesearchaeota archaeon]
MINNLLNFESVDICDEVSFFLPSKKKHYSGLVHEIYRNPQNPFNLSENYAKIDFFIETANGEEFKRIVLKYDELKVVEKSDLISSKKIGSLIKQFPFENIAFFDNEFIFQGILSGLQYDYVTGMLKLESTSNNSLEELNSELFLNIENNYGNLFNRDSAKEIDNPISNYFMYSLWLIVNDYGVIKEISKDDSFYKKPHKFSILSDNTDF